MGATIKVGNVEKDYLEKLPSERFAITMDFTEDLGSGTVSSQTVNAEDSSGSSVTTTVVDGVSESSGVLTIGLKAGTVGEVYTIISSVTSDQTTPAGNTYFFSAKIKMRVL